MGRKMKPIHPGVILKEDLIDVSILDLSRKLNIPSNRIYDIINGVRAVTADTDLRLCKFFGLSAGTFLRMQTQYELEVAEQKIGKELKKIEPLEF